MGELGDLLRGTREEKGISLTQVEETTRIREKYLRALEEENFAVIPNEICLKGFLRNYSLYLGLDPVETRSCYERVIGQADTERRPRAELIGQRTPEYRWIELSLGRVEGPAILRPLILALAVAAVVLIGAWAYNRFRSGAGFTLPFAFGATPTATRPTDWVWPTSTPTPTVPVTPSATLPPTETSTPTVTPTPTPKIYTGVEIELKMLADTWVQVTVDGVKEFEGTLKAGERRAWRGEERVAVRCGNAGGVEVFVNGVSQGIMGNIGQVMDREWRKEDVGAAETPAPVEATPAESLPPEMPTEIVTPTEEPTEAPTEAPTETLTPAGETAETPAPPAEEVTETPAPPAEEVTETPAPPAEEATETPTPSP